MDAMRIEDELLVKGQGAYVDDRQTSNHSIGYVIRSHYPNAKILDVDVEAAKQCPGVLLILTAKDLERKNIGGLPCISKFDDSNSTPIYKPNYPILASSQVRFVGQPIVFIVAETLNQALAAAELVEIDYAELASNSCAEKALSAAFPVWEKAPNNVCFDWTAGDARKVRTALDNAPHVVSIKVCHPRMAVTPIEPRAAIAEFDSETENLSLYVQTQGVHSVHRVLTQDVLKIPAERLRVITQDVGGSFGMKIFTYPEYALVLIAAMTLKCAVSWTASRTESFVSDSHGRARIDQASLGLDSDGKFLALQVSAVADLGAYLSFVSPSVPTVYAYTVIGHTYKIPNIAFRSIGVFTNATPSDAYRGAGKPEMVCTLEQLIDRAAFELQLNRLEIRRKNFVKVSDLPYCMPNGQVIDSGNFEQMLDMAVEKSNWNSFEQRQLKAQSQGLLRGLGLGMYTHSTGGSVAEVCEVRLEQCGNILVFTGTQSGGQGHATTLAQLVAKELQIDVAKIAVLQGDTQAFAFGGGTGGSSLAAIAGVTVVNAARAMLQKARHQAAETLEVSTLDLDYGAGKFFIPGTDRSLALAQIAKSWPDSHPTEQNCAGRAKFAGTNTTHPCGAYVVELECDPDTGVIRIIQIVGVDDIGRILQPKLADGQLHGGWAQAVGTSLMESMQFDEDDVGQVLSATLMDYQIPRAADLPKFKLHKHETLCQTNSLGVKGVGEAANLGAPGALQNALSNLLSNQEFVVVEGPATAHRVWKLLNSPQQS